MADHAASNSKLSEHCCSDEDCQVLLKRQASFLLNLRKMAFKVGDMERLKKVCNMNWTLDIKMTITGCRWKHKLTADRDVFDTGTGDRPGSPAFYANSPDVLPHLLASSYCSLWWESPFTCHATFSFHICGGEGGAMQASLEMSSKAGRSLTKCVEEVCWPLQKLCNLSLQLSKVEVKWKTSCLVPVPMIAHQLCLPHTSWKR